MVRGGYFRIAYHEPFIAAHISREHVPLKIPGQPHSRTPAKNFHNDFIFVVKDLPELYWVKMSWIIVLFPLFFDRDVEPKTC